MGDRVARPAVLSGDTAHADRILDTQAAKLTTYFFESVCSMIKIDEKHRGSGQTAFFRFGSARADRSPPPSGDTKPHPESESFPENVPVEKILEFF